jgi:EAL domain-containing protein (putative c-di-GMP-specific phosphodiesterase class I)
VSPAQVIPIAEEIGMIDRLGKWVLRKAREDAAPWPDPISVSVNLSQLQLKNPVFLETIVSALANSGPPPSRLDVEITEGALMEDPVETVLMLKKIKALGIKVSMDDFGTGCSSLSYLQKFPFDKIKIPS